MPHIRWNLLNCHTDKKYVVVSKDTDVRFAKNRANEFIRAVKAETSKTKEISLKRTLTLEGYSFIRYISFVRINLRQTLNKLWFVVNWNKPVAENDF